LTSSAGATAAVAHKTGRRWVTVELIEETVRRFLHPRLRKVVDGSDAGGITYLPGAVAVEGVIPRQAETFKEVLNKIAASVESLDAETVSALRKAAKVLPGEPRWRGGGGFTVAKMGPSMYEVDDEDGSVYLSPEATNGAWSKAIAGQLKFTLTPDDPVFCGVRKRQRLAVIDGVADETVVRTVVEHLGEKEKAVIVAKGVLPEAGGLLQRLSPGSRIKKAPDDMFPKGTVN
jgi:hypothetical protein